MRIPLVDLSWQHRQIEAEVREGFDRVMQSGAFVMGPPVTEFEEAYARFCEVDCCIGVASGTDALELALRAVGIRRGDEVIPSLNFAEPLNRECAHFVECIREGKQPMTDGWNGLRTVKVLEAAEKSILGDGMPVELRTE